jgi:hypothetical protein
MPASRDDLPEAVDGWRRGEGAEVLSTMRVLALPGSESPCSRS